MERTSVVIFSGYAGMSDEQIRLKLKAAGVCRTVTPIHLKLKRMKFKYDRSFHSAYGLATALGIDFHTVTRWIKSGHLKANSEGQHAQRGKMGTAISSKRKTSAVLSLNTAFIDQIMPAWATRPKTNSNHF